MVSFWLDKIPYSIFFCRSCLVGCRMKIIPLLKGKEKILSLFVLLFYLTLRCSMFLLKKSLVCNCGSGMQVLVFIKLFENMDVWLTQFLILTHIKPVTAVWMLIVNNQVFVWGSVLISKDSWSYLSKVSNTGSWKHKRYHIWLCLSCFLIISFTLIWINYYHSY